MSNVAVKHSLQSPTYWINYTPISGMGATHIVNCIRLMLKAPLRQLTSSFDAHLLDSCSVPDDSRRSCRAQVARTAHEAGSKQPPAPPDAQHRPRGLG